MIKEGILYVSDIVKMTSDFDETIDLSADILTDDDSLPDISFGEFNLKSYFFTIKYCS